MSDWYIIGEHICVYYKSKAIKSVLIYIYRIYGNSLMIKFDATDRLLINTILARNTSYRRPKLLYIRLWGWCFTEFSIKETKISNTANDKSWIQQMMNKYWTYLIIKVAIWQYIDGNGILQGRERYYRNACSNTLISML